MSQIITVPPGAMGGIDFSRDDALHTANLEACVAVGCVVGNAGILMHLRQNDPINDYLGWLSQSLSPVGSRVYLVGGMKGKAERFVADIRAKLRGIGYPELREAVLTDYFIDMLMKRDLVELEYKVRRRTAVGEMDFVHVRNGVL